MTRPTTTGKAQDLITFTRSTTGTYLGSDGLLKSAAINEARIEYDASGNCLGLLMEEARTNKVTYSQDLTHSSWNKQDVTVAAAPIAAPDGTMTANHVVKTGSNGHLSKNAVGTTSDRVSVWARTVSGTGTMYLGYQGVSHEVTVTEEWQRFDAQLNNTNAYVANFRGAATLTEVYLWGAQVETGSFPTSYIPTSGSAVTRAADLASLAVSEFGYNQDQGTVVIGLNNNRGVAGALGDGTFNNDLRFGVVGSNIGRGTGSGFAKSVTTGVFSGQSKIAIGIQEDNYSSAGDGAGAGVNDTSASLPPNPVNIYIGKDYGNYLNGHIKSIQYYPLRLSNAQLQALTV